MSEPTIEERLARIELLLHNLGAERFVNEPGPEGNLPEFADHFYIVWNEVEQMAEHVGFDLSKVGERISYEAIQRHVIQEHEQEFDDPGETA